MKTIYRFTLSATCMVATLQVFHAIYICSFHSLSLSYADDKNDDYTRDSPKTTKVNTIGKHHLQQRQQQRISSFAIWGSVDQQQSSEGIFIRCPTVLFGLL
jgi:hypothetical protein